MATTSEATRESHGRLLVAALLLLGGTTGAVYGRVFLGVAPAVRLAIAGLLAAGIATAMARRSLGLSLAASGSALVVVVGVLVFPEHTWMGLPSAQVVRSAWEALGGVGTDALREVTPASPLPSLFTASLLAVWLAVTTAHMIAVRAVSPVLGLLPPAALLAFSSVVLGSVPRPAYTAAFLASALLVLFAAGVARMRRWGPVVPWSPTGRVRPSGETTGRWGRRLGLGAIGVAILLPGALPGFRGDPMIEMGPGGGDRTSVSPIVDIRPSLLRQPATELFSVTAARPAYWRMLTLDSFNGRVWTASDLDASAGSVHQGESLLRVPAGGEGELLPHTVEIRSLKTPWLPAAQEPASLTLPVDAEGGPVRHDPETGMIVRADGTELGYTYGVVSRLPTPTAKQLRRGPEPGGPGAGFSLPPRYTALPRELAPEIGAIAEQITRGESTVFDRALAIQDHLRTFRYDENAPAGHGVDDMVFFLLQSRRGYCEQFAGTMAVLLRTLDIPTRVAVGFLPGDLDREGRWKVTSAQAHAWVEVFFPDQGWVAFEPTPSRSNPVARAYLAPTPVPGSVPGTFRGEVAQTHGSGSGRATQLERLEDVPGAAASPTPDPGKPVSPWTLAVAAAALALVVALLAIPAGKTLRRRRVLRAAGQGRLGVLPVWAVFEAGAADLGLGRRPAETLDEYRFRLSRDLELEDDRVRGLTSLTARAAYAPVGTDGHGGDAADRARDLLRALRRHAGTPRVVLGSFRPRAKG